MVKPIIILFPIAIITAPINIGRGMKNVLVGGLLTLNTNGVPKAATHANQIARPITGVVDSFMPHTMGHDILAGHNPVKGFPEMPSELLKKGWKDFVPLEAKAVKADLPRVFATVKEEELLLAKEPKNLLPLEVPVVDDIAPKPLLPVQVPVVDNIVPPQPKVADPPLQNIPREKPAGRGWMSLFGMFGAGAASPNVPNWASRMFRWFRGSRRANQGSVAVAEQQLAAVNNNNGWWKAAKWGAGITGAGFVGAGATTALTD